MLALAHTGITLGTTALIAGAVTASSRHSRQRIQLPASSAVDGASSRMISLTNLLDVRFLLVGALLSDIIDKPLGLLLFDNGRVFGHTLLFLVLITGAGFYLYRWRKKSWLFILSLGTFMHLILDQMWQTPQTLLWPLFGLAFPREEPADWIPSILHALTKPEVYLPELAGAVILLWFAWILIKRRKVFYFIRRGQVE